MAEKKQKTVKDTKTSGITKTKKTTPKKTTPKKVKKVQSDEEILKQEEVKTQVVTEAPKTIEEQINSVSTEITSDTNSLAEIEEKIQNELEPVIAITKEVGDTITDGGKFEEKTKKMTNEELKDYTQQQLNRAISLKEKLKRIISKTPFTSFWNGVSNE